MEEKIIFNEEDVNKNKVFGVLAYLGILFLVPLLAAKDSQYARFHTNQGIVFFIFSVIANAFVGIIGKCFGFIPILGVLVSALLSLAVGVVCLVFLILGIVNACSGEAKVLPIIGNIQILK